MLHHYRRLWLVIVGELLQLSELVLVALVGGHAEGGRERFQAVEVVLAGEGGVVVRCCGKIRLVWTQWEVVNGARWGTMPHKSAATLANEGRREHVIDPLSSSD